MNSCDLSWSTEKISQILVDSTKTFAGQISCKNTFVIPSLSDLDNQPELSNYMNAYDKLIEQGDGYLIYDLYQAP